MSADRNANVVCVVGQGMGPIPPHPSARHRAARLRRIAGVTLAAAGTLLIPTAATTAVAVTASTTSPPARQLGFLHVGPPSGPARLPQIADARGRQVLLRGPAVSGLEDYYRPDLQRVYPVDPAAYAGGACPAIDTTTEAVPLCAPDVDAMRALGFDAVRLAVTWNQLEPSPGHIDQTYVARIAQVVGWLKAAGIYTIIDLHQDAWGKYLFTPSKGACPPPLGPAPISEIDGAPRWATTPRLPACALHGVRELDPAVQESFQRLWSDLPGPDGVGLQEHYARVVAALAQRFRSEPAVAGYDLINEPSPGYVAPDAMDQAELLPFYAKVVRTVRAAVPDFRQLVFLEPDVSRDLSDHSAMALPWSAFSSYRQVVWAPHVYTAVFTVDAELNQPALGRIFTLDEAYRSAVRDARALGVPLWVGEFGDDPAQDATLLTGHYAHQDADAVGSAVWVWKENGNSTHSYGVVAPPYPPGTARPSRIRVVSRVYPAFLAGVLGSLRYDPVTGAADLRATSTPVAAGDPGAATVVEVPPGDGRAVRVAGARVQVVQELGGGRRLLVFPCGGPYEVRVG